MTLPHIPKVPAKYQTWAWVYLLGALLYYVQASRTGFNPSVKTALQWPLWLVQTPGGTISILLGSAKGGTE